MYLTGKFLCGAGAMLALRLAGALRRASMEAEIVSAWAGVQTIKDAPVIRGVFRKTG